MPIWVKIGLAVFTLALGLEMWSIATTSMQADLETLHMQASLEGVFRWVSFAFYLVPGLIAIFATINGYKWARSFIFLYALLWLLEYVSKAAAASLNLSMSQVPQTMGDLKTLAGLLSCIFLFLPPSNRWYKATFQNRFANHTRSDRSRVAAFLLAFFLGFFGIHRFYLGKLASGFAFLGLFVSGVVLAGVAASLVYVESNFAPLTVGLGLSAFAIIVTWMTIDALEIWHGEMLDNRGNRVGSAL